MIKCRDSKLRPASVESVAEQLQEQIADVIDDLDKQIVNTPDKVLVWVLSGESRSRGYKTFFLAQLR